MGGGGCSEEKISRFQIFRGWHLRTDMTVINFEKYYEAANPHMQIRRHIYCACAERDTDIIQRNEYYFHNNSIAAG